MSKKASSLNGFTLVELIVTLAVAAILLAIAVPSFQATIQTNRMAANVNEFIGALNLARSEAVKRGVPVTVCKDGGGGSACVNSAQWETGWIVFADLNNDGIVDAADSMLRVYAALSTTYTFRGNLNVRNWITYDPRGRVGLGIGGAGTFAMCDNRGWGSNARAIVVAPTGRARTMPATASGVGACTGI